jgi:hypothetical protein
MATVNTFIAGQQLRKLEFGFQVVKTAVAFPQTATSTLFTVAGGAVLITSFLGRVTTVLTTDPVLTLGTAPTAGTLDVDGIATTTALTSAEVGTWIGIQASSGTGGALVTSNIAGSATFVTTPFVVNAGTITQSTGASHGGKVDWYITYIPLDTGASVS